MSDEKGTTGTNDDHATQIAELHDDSDKSPKEDPHDPESAAPAPYSNFPEGGLRAWGCVAGSYVSVPLAPLITVLRLS
jgi:hypothetical protein